MSFDLYFVKSGGDMQDVSEAYASDDRPSTLTEAHRNEWQAIAELVEPLLTSPDVHRGEDCFELTDLASGLQLSYYPGEIALTIPYWYTDDEADTITSLLCKVAAAVEGVTGLIAYDPQADAPFLDGSSTTAAASMTHTIDRVSEHLAASSERSPWWKRLTRRQ